MSPLRYRWAAGLTDLVRQAMHQVATARAERPAYSVTALVQDFDRKLWSETVADLDAIARKHDLVRVERDEDVFYVGTEEATEEEVVAWRYSDDREETGHAA